MIHDTIIKIIIEFMMNNKHKKTLKDIFDPNVRSNLRWQDIESLLLHIGCKIKEGNGSRVRFIYKNNRLTVHRPHPRPETPKAVVKTVRLFILSLGLDYEIQI